MCRVHDRASRFHGLNTSWSGKWRNDPILSETLMLFLDGRRKAKIKVPSRIPSPQAFDEIMLRARSALTGISHSYKAPSFLDRMYYLLGWVLGDLGKHFYDESKLTVSLDIHLSKRHPENLRPLTKAVPRGGFTPLAKVSHPRPPDFILAQDYEFRPSGLAWCHN